MACGIGGEGNSGVAAPQSNREIWRNSERKRRRQIFEEQWRAAENMYKRDRAERRRMRGKERRRQAGVHYWSIPKAHHQSDA